jgi:Ca-activated chloride channel family protein
VNSIAAALLVLAASAPATPQVVITSPHAEKPAFGAVQFSVSVQSSAPGIRVRFIVDGRSVGEKDRPPFSVITMMGDENAAHEFRAEVLAGSTVISSAELRTPAYETNQTVEVELRQLYVRVTRQHHEAAAMVEEQVADLGRDDFGVVDNGKEQPIRTFASGDTPIAAVVLVDASVSMVGDRLKAALGGAKAFFSAMAPLDEGKVIAFSDRVLHGSPFTNVREVLLAGLDGVRARGGTALNDHVYLALREADQRQGRRVVILLSDGVDSDSVLPMREVRRAARSSQAIIYWIRVEDPGTNEADARGLYSTWRDGSTHRRELVELLDTVTESGGRIVPVHTLGEIEPAFAGILHELRGQYVLGYFPSERWHNGSWHQIGVTVKGTGLTVHTRDGYLDY